MGAFRFSVRIYILPADGPSEPEETTETQEE
jgi:hypothetical protein